MVLARLYAAFLSSASALMPTVLLIPSPSVRKKRFPAAVSIPLLAVLHACASSAPTPAYARLRVDSDPPGADVVIVAELGKTPLVNEFVIPGMYKIELRHKNGYLPAVEELILRADQQTALSHKLKKPPLFTRKRQIQLALGFGAAAGFAYAVIEQSECSTYRQKSEFTGAMSAAANDEYAKNAAEYSKASKDAELKRSLALAAAGVVSAALQITIFIW
jgi:hypothetical protein